MIDRHTAETRTIWLSEYIDTAHIRTLKSCDGWAEFANAAERWLMANGGQVEYYCPGTGDRATYNLQEIRDRLDKRLM